MMIVGVLSQLSNSGQEYIKGGITDDYSDEEICEHKEMSTFGYMDWSHPIII